MLLFSGIVMMAAGLAITFYKDPLIIHLGIRAYKMLHYATYVMYLYALFAIVFSALKYRRMSKKTGSTIREAQLDSKKELKNHEMRELFAEMLDSPDWRKDYDMQSVGNKLIAQMKQMDDYQERLGKLLSTNAAKEQMHDWEDVLERAEQKMCLTMRKGINCLQVYSQNDSVLAVDKMEGYMADNKRILDQVRDFVFAATDFINHQGDSRYDEVSEIGVYKDALLEVLKEDF